MKVKCYRSAKYQNTSIYDVAKITAMPDNDEIQDDDRKYADGIMLCLWLADGGTIFIPHSFLIEIKEG